MSKLIQDWWWDHVEIRHDEPIWISAEGYKYSLATMSTKYIKAIINCILGKGNTQIPYIVNNRTRTEWLYIFQVELSEREDHNK